MKNNGADKSGNVLAISALEKRRSSVAPNWSDAGRCNQQRKSSIPKLESPFLDVPEERFYHDPILWAVENGITSGMTPTTFGPNMSAPVGGLVTFLDRDLAE